jgi:hypothetical protein
MKDMKKKKPAYKDAYLEMILDKERQEKACLLYTSPSPRDH